MEAWSKETSEEMERGGTAVKRHATCKVVINMTCNDDMHRDECLLSCSHIRTRCLSAPQGAPFLRTACFYFFCSEICLYTE